MAYQHSSGPDDAMAMLLKAASTFARPSIFRHDALTDADEIFAHSVPTWDHIRCAQNSRVVSGDRKATICKPKRQGEGRTYTSRYRGVHQTFPTKRWEAQFRRNGKPTSLGYFDEEEEAARAYDKMKIWCELHDPKTLKNSTTNFNVSEYQQDIRILEKISQDDLISSLRSYGREQAAVRLLKRKERGALRALSLNPLARSDPN